MRSTLRTLFVIALCMPGFAQSISPGTFGGLKWRLIGPFRGGRAVAVSGIVGGGSTFFFGAVDGGVWKTTDAGTVWTPLFDSQPAGSIGALAVAPSDPNIIYAGTGESDIRSNLASGDGVYRSSDGGKTWKNVGLKDTRQISKVVVDPVNPDRVFVAALGHAYGPNEERGIFLSTNSGESWQKVLYKGPAIGAADLSMAADAPDVLFAALWEAHRPPWSTYAPIAGSGSGLYRSADGGRTWSEIKGGVFPGANVGRIGVAIARGTHGKRIYATVEASAGNAGLYRSDDGGDTWTHVNSDPRITGRGWYFSSITSDPNDPDVLYIPNVALYKLSDGGKSLSIVRGAPGGDDYHQLWIDPANSQHMALAVDQGTSITLNGGATWSTWYNQPTGQFYHVTTDNQFPYHVYGSQQDSGTAATVSQTDHGQIDGRDWFTVGGSESGYIAVDAKDPSIIYSSGIYGTVERFDKKTGQSQNIAPWPMPSALANPMPKRKYRDPWTPALIFSSAQTNALYLGTQYVMRTLDGGLHWQTISPDLTGAAAHLQGDSKEPVTVANARERGWGVVYSIAPSPLNAGEIWAGSDTGLIHFTRDGGQHWSNVTPDINAWSKVAGLEVSHFAAGEAYAAIDRHRLDDMQPYVYRTRDYGKTWKLVTDGMGERSFVNAVREDPKRKGLLYAATEFGVYVSFDDGEHWLALQLNMPVTSVRDLTVHGDDLVAATHGRSFWILDDVAPLRQISESIASAKALLFKPASAVRMKSDAFSGTPLPPEEPQATNPPRGAYLDYYLGEPAQSEVVLTVLDLRGKVIRRFSSKDKPAATPENAPIAPRWFEKPPEISKEAGMHRWVWDLRCGQGSEAASMPGGDEDDPPALGPLVMPGAYRVKLTVDGTEFTQPLTVTMDPRARVTNEELTQQFTWSQRVYGDMLQANRAAEQLKALQSRLTEEKARASSTQTAVRDAMTAADRAAGELGTGDTGLPALGRTLNALLGALESGDRMPPAQVIEAYGQTAKSLRIRLAEWETAKKTKVADLNSQLRAAGLAEVNLAR